MTKAQLIAMLAGMPDDADIYVTGDDGEVLLETTVHRYGVAVDGTPLEGHEQFAVVVAV